MSEKHPWPADNIVREEYSIPKIHKDHFQGVDTSYFKVWVLRNGKLARVTKQQALSKGYKIVASTKRRPDISQVRNA